MSHTLARSIVVALIVQATLVCLLSHAETQPRQPLLVLVSAATGGGDISLGKLRSVYENQPTDHRGIRLIPFNQAIGTTARAQFDRAVLGLEPDRVGAFWIDQKIRSGISPPRSVATVELLLRVIASLRGVISYVQMPASSVPAGIVVLTVDGKSPADAAYPFAK